MFVCFGAENGDMLRLGTRRDRGPWPPILASFLASGCPSRGFRDLSAEPSRLGRISLNGFWFWWHLPCWPLWLRCPSQLRWPSRPRCLLGFGGFLGFGGMLSFGGFLGFGVFLGFGGMPRWISRPRSRPQWPRPRWPRSRCLCLGGLLGCQAGWLTTRSDAPKILGAGLPQNFSNHVEEGPRKIAVVAATPLRHPF